MMPEYNCRAICYEHYDWQIVIDRENSKNLRVKVRVDASRYVLLRFLDIWYITVTKDIFKVMRFLRSYCRLDTRKYVYIRLSRFSIRSWSHPNITTLVLDLERLCTCIYVRIRSIRSSRTDMLYCVWIWWWLRSLLRLRGRWSRLELRFDQTIYIYLFSPTDHTDTSQLNEAQRGVCLP